MNWGTKLIIGMLCFMGFIITMGVIMMTSKKDALVDNDYYEKGINYNHDYVRKENVRQDHAEPIFQVLNDTLHVQFIAPSEGTFKIIRTADKRLDRSLSFKTDAKNIFVYPLRGKATGLWKIQLDWKSKDKSYLFEKEIML
jgi:hypothetical protein